MKLRIAHTTTYCYDAPVSYALQQVRLTPCNATGQTVLDWDVSVEGGTVELAYDDHYANRTLLINTTPGETELRITASGHVETADGAGVLGKVYGTAPLWHFKQQTARTKPGPKIRALANIIETDPEQLQSLHALSTAILAALPYGSGQTVSDTPAEDALSAQTGVCQDHAQIFISAARAAGIPARYISGYLMLDDRIDQDATHAWAEAHLDGIGWVGFDVSNGISPDERYVRIAVGLDARSAAPVSGMRLGASSESMIVSLQVQQ